MYSVRPSRRVPPCWLTRCLSETQRVDQPSCKIFKVRACREIHSFHFQRTVAIVRWIASSPVMLVSARQQWLIAAIGIELGTVSSRVRSVSLFIRIPSIAASNSKGTKWKDIFFESPSAFSVASSSGFLHLHQVP